MRVVLDTKLLISALVYRGLPARLLLLFENPQHTLYTLPLLLAELEEVIFRKKFGKPLASGQSSARQLFDGLVALACTVKTSPLAMRVSRDEDDDAVLACALAARADLIVSGDDDLLVLKQFQGIPIMKAGEALEMLSG
jgi:putative PIN family toxin of toxin-antitoxin system